MYSIKLADGTVIANLELNGNNFISQDEIDEDQFDAYNLTSMEVSDGEKTEVWEDMRLCNFWTAADGTHMVFCRLSSEEKRQAELNAKLEYIAMMADIDLD